MLAVCNKEVWSEILLSTLDSAMYGFANGLTALWYFKSHVKKPPKQCLTDMHACRD